MAVASSRGRMDPLRQWRDKDTSPERTKVWKEPKPKKVSVVYYLSRGGQLEHPHFMEVALSSTDGLYLRACCFLDVIDRLNLLRGKGMANLYSWSSKRSYKNGFVWHDLTEDDLIHPTRGHEYVLKGSELLQPLSSPSFQEGNAAFSASEKPLQIPKSVHDDFESLQVRRKRAPWSSFDLNEYKVYKTDLTAETGAKAADASTQTDDGRSRRRSVAAVRREEEEGPLTTELEREDISPPLSSSSSETLEKLIKADARAITSVAAGSEDQERTVGTYASGRIRASAMLMHLLSCGSINMKDHHGGSVSPQTPALCKPGAVARAVPDLGGRKETYGLLEHNGSAAIRMEDKEYFSGSLIETKKTGNGRDDFSGLKRSSSYNADRGSKLELAEKEIEGVRAKCIPRKHKTMLEREGAKATNLAQLSRKQIE
ncbi:protein SOSEKI 5-like isoform X1 [Zingiber officinale]|nr:protein SOSEKI 5-like isoform X1 [Zingiber officinale]